jgi:hypothetical protein
VQVLLKKGLLWRSPESQQEYNVRRDGPHSTMQTVSQIIM